MSTAPVDPSAPAMPGLGQSVEDLVAELGLEPETPAGDKPTPKPEVEAPAEGGEKPAEAPAEGDKEPEQAAASDDDVEDPDQKQIREIMARSRERRRLREAARARPAAPAAPASQAAPEKPETPAAKPEGPAPSAGVQAAVRDVLLQLDKLAGEDEAARASGQQPTQAATDKREAVYNELREKIDAITKALEKGDPEMRERIQTMSAALETMENVRIAQMIVTRTVDSLESELPSLHNPEVLRTLKRPDGTRYRDPADVVYDAASKFYEKFKVMPDLKILAKRIEKKLSAGSEKQTSGNVSEKRSPSRKTISSSQGSPPAARTGPDSRSAKDAESDFFTSLNIDPHQ